MRDKPFGYAPMIIYYLSASMPNFVKCTSYISKLQVFAQFLFVFKKIEKQKVFLKFSLRILHSLKSIYRKSQRDIFVNLLPKKLNISTDSETLQCRFTFFDFIHFINSSLESLKKESLLLT